VRRAALLALAAGLLAGLLGYAAGYYEGSKPRVCAYVTFQAGSGVVCTNDAAPWLVQ